MVRVTGSVFSFLKEDRRIETSDRLTRPAAAFPRRWRRAPGPSRTPRRRGGTPSGRTRARPHAGRGSRGRRPSRGRTRRAPPPSVPPAGRASRREPVRRRVRVGVEGRLAVARVAGPPADRDLLRVHRVAHDEVLRRRLGRQAREQVDGEVERAPPCVDRRRAPAVRRAEGGQHERRAGRGGEVGSDLSGVVARVLVVLVERHAPRDLLRGRVDLDGARQGADRLQNLARDLADRPVGGERDAPGAARRCARRPPRGCEDRARRRAPPSRPAPAAERSPSRARSDAAPRAGAAARAGRAPPPACRGPGCARAACRRSRSTARRKALTMQSAWPHATGCSRRLSRCRALWPWRPQTPRR